jgi:hypothetical protein
MQERAVSISDTAQQVIFNALGTVWLGVGAIIFMRCRLLQNASIRWIKQEMGWAMGDLFFVVGSLRSARQAHRLLHDPGPDAESEQIGREVWRRFRHSLSWIFGSPVLGDGVAALRIATGRVRLQ